MKSSTIIAWSVVVAAFLANLNTNITLGAKQPRWQTKNKALETKIEALGCTMCNVKCKNSWRSKVQSDAECSKCCRSVNKKYYGGSCKISAPRAVYDHACFCGYFEVQGNKPEYWRTCAEHCYNKNFDVDTKNHKCGLCCKENLGSVKSGICKKIGPYGMLGVGCYCLAENAATTKSKGLLTRSWSAGRTGRRNVRYRKRLNTT